MSELSEKLNKAKSCAEFQELLPELMESGGVSADAAHLRTCANCAELVRDLNYIAEQAKLLLPMRDPSPQVWNNIEQSMRSEGLVNNPAAAQPSLVKKNSARR
jgi:hypothetical protein